MGIVLRQKTGGRQLGTPNKATAAVRKLAAEYVTEAIEVLVSLMRNSDDDRTRLVAAKELLDRAYGHPGQAPQPPDQQVGPITVR